MGNMIHRCRIRSRTYYQILTKINFQRGKLITNQRIEAKYMIEDRIKNITENETNDRTEKIIMENTIESRT